MTEKKATIRGLFELVWGLNERYVPSRYSGGAEVVVVGKRRKRDGWQEGEREMAER